MKSKFIVSAILSSLFLMNIISFAMIPTFGELQEQVRQLTEENQRLREENAQLHAQLHIPSAAPAIVTPKPLTTLPNPNFELFAGPATFGYYIIYKLKIDDKPETNWQLVPQYEKGEQPISLQFTKKLVLTTALTKDITDLRPLKTTVGTEIKTTKSFTAKPNEVYFCIIIRPSTRADIVGPQILPQDVSGPIAGQWDVVPHTPKAKQFAKNISDRFKKIQQEKNLPKNWRQ